jgi:RNA methyltransferase, TrmH family
MITSRDNQQLKQIHKLQRKRERDATGLFVAEGEDLVATAERSGWTPEIHLRSGEDVEPELLDRVSSLGSGTRVIGVYRQRWSEPRGDVCVYLHGVADPGNVGTIVRAAHALCDGPAILGEGCADPFGPKAVRASMGSLFARPPARARLSELPGTKLGLDAGAGAALADAARDLEAPLVLCVGGEREGFPEEVVACLDAIARIPQRPDGPDSLNVAMAATIGLYELGNRMAGHG